MLDEICIRFNVVEILGDRYIGTGVYFALKEHKVVATGSGIRMHFRIGANDDLEAVAEVLADQAHQVFGVL